MPHAEDIRFRNQVLSRVTGHWQSMHISQLFVQLDYAYYFTTTPKRKHVGWHEHRFFEFSHLRKGSVCYQTREREIEVPEGGMFFMPCGTTHSWMQTRGPLLIDSLALYISPHDSSQLTAISNCIEAMGYHLNGCPTLKAFYDGLWSVTNPKVTTLLRTETATQIVRSIILYFLREYCTEAFPGQFETSKKVAMRGRDLSVEIHAFIENHLEGNLTLGELARNFNYSGRQINRIYSEHYGTSVSAAIIDMKMRRARELLLNHDLPIKAVAYNLGFKDVSYFCRFFRKYSLLSPQKYRETMLTTKETEANSRIRQMS